MSRIDVEEDMKKKNNEYNIVDQSNCKKTTVYWSPEKSRDIKINMSNYEPKKGTVVYCIRLERKEDDYSLKENSISYDIFGNVSGICRFVEDLNDLNDNLDSNDDANSLRRFIILNFHGIYNFECDDDFDLNLKEKFNYPKSVRRELDYWYTKKDCTDRLLSCIYSKYFLVKQYRENAQSIEGKQLFL